MHHPPPNIRGELGAFIYLHSALSIECSDPARKNAHRHANFFPENYLLYRPIFIIIFYIFKLSMLNTALPLKLLKYYAFWRYPNITNADVILNDAVMEDNSNFNQIKFPISDHTERRLARRL